MASCEGCGAAIVWAETTGGGKQPFNREPHAEGNRVLLGRGPDKPPLAVPVEWVEVPDSWAASRRKEEVTLALGYLSQTLYMPHHAVCPQAERFRR